MTKLHSAASDQLADLLAFVVMFTQDLRELEDKAEVLDNLREPKDK